MTQAQFLKRLKSIKDKLSWHSTCGRLRGHANRTSFCPIEAVYYYGGTRRKNLDYQSAAAALRISAKLCEKIVAAADDWGGADVIRLRNTMSDIVGLGLEE